MRWEIRAPWPSLSEVERRFDEILRSRWGAKNALQTPRLAVVGSEIRIEMDLPGLSEEDVRVRVEGHEVIIEGRSGRIAQGSPGGATDLSQESFGVRFPLPPECTHVSHDFRHVSGLLSIRIRARAGEAEDPS